MHGGRHSHSHSHSRFSKFVSLVSGRPRVSTVRTFIYYGALISAMYRRAGGPCQGRNLAHYNKTLSSCDLIMTFYSWNGSRYCLVVNCVFVFFVGERHTTKVSVQWLGGKPHISWRPEVGGVSEPCAIMVSAGGRGSGLKCQMTILWIYEYDDRSMFYTSDWYLFLSVTFVFK